MDADSIAIIVSLVGLAGAPLWDKLADRVVIGARPATALRLIGKVVVSLLILAAVFIGPWIAMISWQGLVHRIPSDPNLPLGFLILFGPGLIGQTIFSIADTRKRYINK